MCARCRSEFSDTSHEVCPFDGWGLVKPEDYYEAEGDPLLGALIAGRFRIVSRVGVGAMGTVYKAIQSSVDRPVALKVLRHDLTRDPETAARFNREARATSALKHPNTVTLYDYGQTEEGHLYIAMELLEGRLLGRVLKEDGELQIDLAVRIVIQVARSLAEAHHKGIVHRDLKPDNIMLAQVEGQEVVKVLDFGIAKIVHGDRRIDALETQAGTVFGTPRYMSPEQAQSKALDRRSDIYSLGVIFYQMLTGHAPFEDADAVVVMARHIKTKPRRPSDVRPDLDMPRQIERLVMRMLEKDCKKRPQSAEELVDELTRYAHHGPQGDLAVFAEPPSVSRKRPILPIAAAVAGAGVLAIGAVIAFALGGPDPAPAPIPLPSAEARPRPAAVLDPARPPTKAPEVRTIEVTLDSVPTGANVTREGQVLGTTPLVVIEQPGVEVSFSFDLAGYEAESTRFIISGETRSHTVTLTRVRTAAQPPQEHEDHTGPARPADGTAAGQDDTPSKRPGYGRLDDR
jgi:serine/threonine-protein kinase